MGRSKKNEWSNSVVLGAYTSEITLDIFELEGYISPKDLDDFFADSYSPLDTKLSKDEFIKKSKANILKDPKYIEFVDGNKKKCSDCNSWKPLSSYNKTHKKYKDKVYEYTQPRCKICQGEYSKKYYSNNKDKISIVQKKHRNTEKGRATNKRCRDRFYSKHRNRAILKTKTRNMCNYLTDTLGYPESVIVMEEVKEITMIKEKVMNRNRYPKFFRENKAASDYINKLNKITGKEVVI